MAEYIEREAFIADQRRIYCENCDRRKGVKNGKVKFVYAIGDAPCRACDIGDMLDSVEDYPAADVAPVVHGKWKNNHCSVCGMIPMGEEIWDACEFCPPRFEFFMNYCPNCGALMDKDGDEK